MRNMKFTESEYITAKAVAWDKYQKRADVALAKYDKAMKEAWAEYEEAGSGDE